MPQRRSNPATIFGLGIFLWQKPLRGERKADYGRVYYFADSFIAEDTSHPTNEFYIVEIDPESIKRVDLDGDGIAIHLKRNAPEELVSNIVSSVRAESGRVATCRRYNNGYAWRMDVAMDSTSIQNVIVRQNWDASIRALLGNKRC